LLTEPVTAAGCGLVPLTGAAPAGPGI